MTIEDADRVDSITGTPEGDRFTLLMFEERLFDGSDTQFQQLLDKINAYIEYLQSGQFYREYPAARGQQVRVRLLCRNDPVGERFDTLLGAATTLFGRHGVHFGVEIIPSELLGSGPDGTTR